MLPTLREGSGCAWGLTGPPWEEPEPGAGPCCLHCVRARQGAYAVTMPSARRCAWPSALAPGCCGACRPRLAWAAPHPRLVLTGQHLRVEPTLCLGRDEGTDTLLGRRARTDASLHSSLGRREHLQTCVVQPRAVAP